MGGRRGKNVPNLGEGLVASKLNEATNELVEGTVCHRRVKMGVDNRLEGLERKGHQVCCWQQIKKMGLNRRGAEKEQGEGRKEKRTVQLAGSFSQDDEHGLPARPDVWGSGLQHLRNTPQNLKKDLENTVRAIPQRRRRRDANQVLDLCRRIVGVDVRER